MRLYVNRAMALAAVVAVAGCAEVDAPTDVSSVIAQQLVHDPSAPVAPLYGIGAVHRSYPTSGCTEAAYRQFDFWLGAWQVNAARSHITSILDGCIVHERFAGPAGFGGQSLNMYDAETGKWYQYWAGDFGFPLVLEGGLRGAQMVLSGDLDLGGYIWTDRITWTALQGGMVRQLWDRSTDHGSTFPTVAFDGLYTPVPGLEPFPFRNPGVCSGGNFETMSFLVGNWTVYAENGLELGSSEVSRSVSGCIIQERFTTPKGYESLTWMFSYYGRFGFTEWKRVTVDNQGERLGLSGAPSGSGVVYAGTEAAPGGRVLDVLLQISPATADEVRLSFQIGPAGQRPPFVVVYRRT